MNSKRLLLLVLSVGLTFHTVAQRVFIQQSEASPQRTYATEQLSKALDSRKYAVTNDAKLASFTIRLAPLEAQLGAESYRIDCKSKLITVTGSDSRGLIYGCLSLVEDIQNGLSLNAIRSRSEKPHLPLRAIKFDLPWDTYRHSDALDLHYENLPRYPVLESLFGHDGG